MLNTFYLYEINKTLTFGYQWTYHSKLHKIISIDIYYMNYIEHFILLPIVGVICVSPTMYLIWMPKEGNYRNISMNCLPSWSLAFMDVDNI